MPYAPTPTERIALEFVVAEVPETSAVYRLTDDPEARKIMLELEAKLRERDDDPAFADAPIIDVYARLSVAPDGTVEKVDRQVIDCLQVLVKGHYRLGRLWWDKGRSAWKRNRKRKGWDNLLRRFERREIQGVICWHLDRLLRQPYDLEVLIQIAFGREAFVLSYSGTWDLRNTDHCAMARMITIMACKASDDTSRRILRNNEARKAKMLLPEQPLFGHPFLNRYERENTPFEPCSVDEPCSLCQQPGLKIERDYIRYGIKAVSGGAVWDDVADHFNAWNVYTRNGKQWTASRIATMLKKPRHAGYLTEGEGEDQKILGLAANGHPIVTEAEWALFEARLSGRRRGRQHGRGDKHLLTGLVRCGTCGGRLNATQVVRGKGGIEYSYRCVNKFCTRKAIAPAWLLEAACLQIAAAELSNPRHKLRIRQASKAIASKKAEMKSVEDYLDGLMVMHHAGDITQAQMRKHARRLNEQLTTLSRELAELQRKGGSVVEPAVAADLFGNLETVAQKRTMLRAVAGDEMLDDGVDCGFLVAPATPGKRTMSVDAMARRVSIARLAAVA